MCNKLMSYSLLSTRKKPFAYVGKSNESDCLFHRRTVFLFFFSSSSFGLFLEGIVDTWETAFRFLSFSFP